LKIFTATLALGIATLIEAPDVSHEDSSSLGTDTSSCTVWRCERTHTHATVRHAGGGSTLNGGVARGTVRVLVSWLITTIRYVIRDRASACDSLAEEKGGHCGCGDEREEWERPMRNAVIGVGMRS
jgi:hypothetical protein